MREIKFRAWVTDASVMSDVIGLTSNSEGVKWLTLFKSIKRPYRSDYRMIDTSKRIAAHRAVLMQYTGLKDKNGVEVYEGDVISDSFDRSVIRHGWAADAEVYGRSYGWFLEYLPDADEPNYTATARIITGELTDSVVIGNIYENPELLKGGDA